MATITQNYGDFLTMIFSTLDRKPITNQEDRNNYKEVLLHYCNFLYKLAPLPSNVYFISQKKFIEKLDVYLGRYKSIGSEFLSDDKLESFLSELQDYMRDYVNDMQKAETELFQFEKKFYSSLCYEDGTYNKVSGNTQTFMDDQQTALEKLKSKINLPNFKTKYVDM